MSGSETTGRRGSEVQYSGRQTHRRGLSWGFGVISILLAGSEMAMCQFVVTPMKIETTARPRVRVEAEIRLENQERTEQHYVTLSTTELTQNEDGSWLPVDPNNMDPNNPIDLSRISSCRSWIRLPPSNEQIRIPTLKTVPIKVEIDVPPGVKGFFCAGIVVSLLPRPDTEGVNLQYDFIVPVFLQIEGTALYHKIQLVDGGIEAAPQTEDASASTLVTLSVENLGATKSRLSLRAQVRAYMDNTTRVIVREQKFPDVDIIPGSRLKLKGDMARTLSAGNYLVTGTLFVDGKRAKAIEKEVSYAGDKTATKIYADAVIQTDPSAVLIETSPGNMKSITVKVTQRLRRYESQIRAHMLTPKALGGFVVFGKRGDDLSCAEWIEVTPSEFELRGFSSQNIKIVSKMPEGGMDYRGYYADLNLYASYADGTNAGMTSAQVCVVNRQVASNPMVEARDVKIENTEPSKYIVSARFVNEGDVHVSPKCEAQLVQTDGSANQDGDHDL